MAFRNPTKDEWWEVMETRKYSILTIAPFDQDMWEVIKEFGKIHCDDRVCIDMYCSPSSSNDCIMVSIHKADDMDALLKSLKATWPDLAGHKVELLTPDAGLHPLISEFLCHASDDTEDD